MVTLIKMKTALNSLWLYHSLITPGSRPFHLSPGVPYADQPFSATAEIHLTRRNVNMNQYRTDYWIWESQRQCIILSSRWCCGSKLMSNKYKYIYSFLTDLPETSDRVSVSFHQLLERDRFHIEGTGNLWRQHTHTHTYTAEFFTTETRNIKKIVNSVVGQQNITVFFHLWCYTSSTRSVLLYERYYTNGEPVKSLDTPV